MICREAKFGQEVENFVPAELAKRGYLGSKMLGNKKGSDILAVTSDI